jgi:hypothetical protein
MEVTPLQIVQEVGPFSEPFYCSETLHDVRSPDTK